MMKYKDKEYETILWDWRSTLYDPNTESLYPWVEDFFKTARVNHILVSWALNPQKRTELIESFSISKKFLRKYISSTKKRQIFEQIFDQDGFNPETTIVIGDNINDEISIANDLAIDSIHVDSFVKEFHLAK